MLFLLLSFAAGLLTVLAPCVLPVLPIIIGGTIGDHAHRNPVVITASLAVAVVAFTLILKVSTLFVNIPELLWHSISGIIIIGFGVITVFPTLWERLSARFAFGNSADKLLSGAVRSKSRSSDILLGLALGPVFSSCSPTYFVILADVLPKSFAAGLVDLIVYAIGLSLGLLELCYLGKRAIGKAAWAANPHGVFKRSIGVIFLLVGVMIATGFDRTIQTYAADHGYFDTTRVEQFLLERTIN